MLARQHDPRREIALVEATPDGQQKRTSQGICMSVENEELSSDREQPITDKILATMEFVTVLIIFAMFVYFTLYLVCASEQDTRQIYLRSVLREINDNWKAGLLLLVPLFYRTVRMFLERVETVAGIKARPRPPQKQSETKKIPPEENS